MNSVLAVLTWGWFALGLAMAVPDASAAQEARRTLYVASGAVGGNGLSAEKPLPSINAALKMARRGDTLRIAPGEYRETLRISTPGLVFEGGFSAENIPLVKVSAPKNGGPLLVDSANSIWRGIGFYGQNAAVAELRGFTGRFEHCLFDMDGLLATINIYGGKPQFFASTFLGHPGPAGGINVQENKTPGQTITFAYCLFRDIEGGVVLLRGAQDIEFVNCLFANFQYVVIRHNRINSSVSAVNSVFYLHFAPHLFLQNSAAPKNRLENCIYAPAPAEYMIWSTVPLERQPEVELFNTMTASPRFEKGRQVLLNLCIDDTANAQLWSKLTPLAEGLGQKITLALNTDALTPQYWSMIIPQVNKGFEVASHAAVHSSMTARDVLSLAWHSPENSSALLVIDEEKNFTVRVDDKEAFSLALQIPPYPTMGDLARLLQEQGFRAELMDLSHRKIPAYLLHAVKGQDIFFENHEPVLSLDSEAYMRYMLAESRRAIEEGLKENNALQRSCTAIVCPYAETSPDMVQAMDATGYVISRSRMERNFASALQGINLYYVNSVTLKNLVPSLPLNSLEEGLRIYFDYLKYHGSIMGLYAHASSEFNFEQWLTLLDVASQDPQVKTISLASMAAQVQEMCMPTGNKGEYRCPEDKGPVQGEISFRPGPLSPLLKAGKPTSFSSNFAGENLPQGEVPNIGLY